MKEKFTDKERDAETGLDYFGARYYASGLGRWLSVDPMAELYPAQTPYNYVLNNPIGETDSSGMCPDKNDPNCDYAFESTAPGEAVIEADKFTPQVISSLFFDFKHAVERALFNTYIFKKLVKDPGEGMKWSVDYKKDQYGNEIFETEVKAVPKEGFLKEGLNNTLDAVTILGAGSGGNPAGFLAKTPAKSALVQETRKVSEQLGNDYQFLTDKRLKNAGIDAHKVKKDEFGDNAPIARYDLYKDKATGQIVILRKGGKGTPIETGIKIK